MKSIFNIYLTACLFIILHSCSEKYDVYNLQDNKLGFTYGIDVDGETIVYDSVVRYTFAYKNSQIIQDTVWVEMVTSGHIVDYDRPFMIEQIEMSQSEAQEQESIVNAQAGLHYLAFDDPSLADYMVVKAGENRVKFPIILKRDDPYLLESSVYLKVKLKENENFKESFKSDRFYRIEITNQLVKPEEWDIALWVYFGGDYGPVKLRFMIDVATWTIDEAWFRDNFGSYEIIDQGYTGYLCTYFVNKLIELNRARRDQGLDVLKEADGTIVQFVNFMQPQPYI